VLALAAVLSATKCWPAVKAGDPVVEFAVLNECVRMSQELSAEQIQQALQGITIPPQPQIMVDLQFEQYMPDPDLETIAKLISQDPGLSGALLKLVNSPHFGLSNKIGSIQRAVNLLGSRSIINLINAQSIKGEMSDETIVTLNRFWDTAQDVAMTCLTLAKRTGMQSADEAYTLGLFHDCGVPLMLKRFPNYMEVLEEAYAKADGETRVVDTENRAFNTNHSVVGYFTAKSWRLPEHLTAAIANHHNALAVFRDKSSRNAQSQMKNLLAVLKMAEHICASYRVLGSQSVDHEWQVVGPLVLDYIGLSDYDFENLKQNIRELGGH
jgi:HD-like signal output (HDOD) protein